MKSRKIGFIPVLYQVYTNREGDIHSLFARKLRGGYKQPALPPMFVRCIALGACFRVSCRSGDVGKFKSFAIVSEMIIKRARRDVQ